MTEKEIPAALVGRAPSIFLAAIEPELNTGCWLWARMIQRGYGVIKFRGGGYFAHRVAYAAHVGPLLPGLRVCHKCDTPLCVNPVHLFLGTPADNSADMVRKGRAWTWKGGRAGEKNPSAKLSWAKAESIRAELAQGDTPPVIAKRYGVSPAAIYLIRNGERWKDA